MATDLAESYRAGPESLILEHATRVADPFHVVRVANRCVDKVRRRVQNETLDHRGRKDDPALSHPQAAPHRRRAARRERQRPHAAGSARRATPRTRCWAPGWPRSPSETSTSPPMPRWPPLLLDKAIAGCIVDEVEEIRSLGHTLKSWRTEILAHHDTGASNGPTEGLNLCVKQVKRCGHGFKKFEHYRLRVLLHAGGVTWPIEAPSASNPNPLSPLRRVGPL